MNLNPSLIKAVVWDWNGTLLDDVHTCVESINMMLRQRQLHELDYDSYRSVFGFPVKDYYERAGFDFSIEPFDGMAIEFIDLYRERLPFSLLFDEVEPTLKILKKQGYRQFILSAMEQQMLETSLTDKGIFSYFDLVAGTTDHYANGKDLVAKRLSGKIGLPAHHILLIGDTVHDHEVAAELGWQCVLIPNGHQDEGRLRSTGRIVYGSLSQIAAMLDGYSESNHPAIINILDILL
ncbi:MAG: HAD family hydrolase [Bacteroidales bacterium]|nr:HAD family hydrolase [Bacteroidales bacterium]MDZ4204232.1 HAD family hydrolase [Bacteroidales bacterium]